ncbi:MAG: DUF5615 family PIN-like protein [Calditrichia bacterium]
MAKFLIDANLPYQFSLWQDSEFLHVYELGDDLPDSEIWTFALKNTPTIVSKDADFTDRAAASRKSPRIIHLRVGNLRLKELYDFLVENWSDIRSLSEDFEIVQVFTDRLEGIDISRDG